ncbi:hypothetical protein F511_37634 [Dorcoceras hygrometricum]|uniref:Uncharacterized protein n=1 Tax=Dorcoceras hygrometricum TaxID=472368 RepID=A0A2Z7C2L8_9LAMI|nr:hypothetical protein F511_37634 [Dorcoceras hygrometricum]
MSSAASREDRDTSRGRSPLLRANFAQSIAGRWLTGCGTLRRRRAAAASIVRRWLGAERRCWRGRASRLARRRARMLSDDDKHPLATLVVARTGGVAAKCKLILSPSDSETTVSLTLLEIKKKQRTKRPKLVKPIPTEMEKAMSKDLSLQDRHSTGQASHHMAKLEDEFLLWAETDRVSELMQRRLLVQFRLYEKQLQEAVDKHRAEFDKAAPSANCYHM